MSAIITPIHSGLACLWNQNTALVIDTLSGDRISSFSLNSSFVFPAENQTQQQQRKAVANTTEQNSQPRIVFVGASPPYAIPPENNKKRRAANFASPSASFSAVLMLVVEVSKNEGVAVVFVAAETGEALGMTSILPRESNQKVLNASCSPVFAEGYTKHRSLYAAQKIAFILHFADATLITGSFSRKKAGTVFERTSTSCLGFAFSVDLESKQTLLHVVESKNNNQAVVLREFNAKYETDACFNFSWESQAVSTKDALEILFSSNSSSPCFVKTDSREAIKGGRLACYVITGKGVVCFSLTPESTETYQWKFSSSSSATPASASAANKKKTTAVAASSSSQLQLSDVRVIEKQGAKNPFSVGILMISSEERKVGVAWIDFSAGGVPNQTLKESWENFPSSNNNTSTSSSIATLISPNTSSSSEFTTTSDQQLFFSEFVSSSQKNSSGLLLKTNMIGLSSSVDSGANNSSVVLDTTDINGEEDSSLTFFDQHHEGSYQWVLIRDLVLPSNSSSPSSLARLNIINGEENGQQQQQQEQNDASSSSSSSFALITFRVSTEANRAEMDLAEWFKWHVMGDALSKAASVQPNLLFIFSGAGNSSSTSPIVSASRWPSPVLRVALRSLGGEAIRTLAQGLLENFYTSCNQNNNNNNKNNFSFALACAVKVIESCVTMQRSLGVSFDSIVGPFVQKLEQIEKAWENTGTIGHRVASISALSATIQSSNQLSALKKQQGKVAAEREQQHQLYFDTKVAGNQQNNTSVSTTTMDNVSTVVSALKKQYEVPNDLF